MLMLAPYQTLILPAFLGLGIAAASGLRTFLPITMLAFAAHFGLFGTTLNPHLAWLGSTPFLVGLSVATVVELAADKIPVVDHLLSAVGTVTRPMAGWLAASAVFTHLDPATAALAGLIIGVPAALTMHTAQTGARVVSTATTLGLGNPALSGLEDGAAAVLAGLAIAFPVLGAILALALVLAVIGLWRRLTRKRAQAATVVDAP
jgi:hypothetical protein